MIITSPVLVRLIGLLLFLGWQMAPAADQPAGGTVLPQGGTQLLAAQPTVRIGSMGTSSSVPVTGLPFASALHLAVTRVGQPWDVELKVPVPAALAKGDTLLLRIWLRAVRSRTESGDVSVAAMLQQAGPNWAKPFTQGVSASKEWREQLMPFALDRDFVAGGSEIVIHCGDREQEFEIGGFELWSYGTALKPAQLPRSRTMWAGMEPDAPWRAEAAARIERLRKGDLAVRVLDAAGKPVAGAEVRVRQLRHAFPFGTAVAASILGGKSTPDRETYRSKLGELFNAAVLENDTKWGAWAGEWGASFNREQTLAALRWLQERNFFVRGHVLVWPSWGNMPKSAKALEGDKAALRKLILDHIDDLAGSTKGLIAQWDVLNEPFSNHDIMDLCGREVMVEWFRRARERLPADCGLYINDYAIVAAGGATDTPHQRHYYETIRYLLDQGAPLEGIGVQSHFGSQPTPPKTALAILDRLAEFKLPIMVTEFDVNTVDEEYQAAFTRDYLTVCFSHPSIKGFIMWGFWAGAQFAPQAAMLRKDWSEKPNMAVWRELVMKTWWTDQTVRTGADGVARVRGFKGAYEVGSGGRTMAATIGDAPAEAVLKP